MRLKLGGAASGEERNMIGRGIGVIGVVALSLLAGSSAFAQREPAMNAPDMFAWRLFTRVSAYRATPGNNNALFETWASDPDTFNATPRWPGKVATARPLVASVLARRIAAHRPTTRAAPAPSDCLEKWKSGKPPCIGEEVRRNRVAFDYIVQNGLNTQAGLVAMFGTPISFPIDSIEVKADWIPADELNSWNGTDLGKVSSLYHVNTVPGPDGKPVVYALVAITIISKR